jgi:hypothetical protein
MRTWPLGCVVSALVLVSCSDQSGEGFDAGAADARADSLGHPDALPGDPVTANDAALAHDVGSGDEGIGDAASTDAALIDDAPLAHDTSGAESPAARDASAERDLGAAGMDATGSVDASGIDASTACALPTSLTFGVTGAFSAYSYVNKLDTSGILTITRVAAGDLADAGPNPSCSRPLPACGTAGMITVATLVSDLSDPDVGTGFAASSTPLYGRAVPDAGLYSVVRADGRGILVGWACDSVGAACQDIPAGVQRLITDLEDVSSTVIAAPECHALNGAM